MKRNSLVFFSALLLSLPTRSEAQWAVYDAAAVAEMVMQVDYSEAQLNGLLQNLLPALGQSVYNLRGYEGLLRGMSEAVGGRPHVARNLDQFQADVQPEFGRLYPGVVPTKTYPIQFARSAETLLNTGESYMGQVHVSAGQEGDDRFDTVHNALYERNEQAQGELGALQVGNAVTLTVADGVRRVEKSNAAIASMIALRNAHDVQREAWGEAAVEQFLSTVGGGPPGYHSGARGGVRYFGNVAGPQ